MWSVGRQSSSNYRAVNVANKSKKKTHWKGVRLVEEWMCEFWPYSAFMYSRFLCWEETHGRLIAINVIAYSVLGIQATFGIAWYALPNNMSTPLLDCMFCRDFLPYK